MASTPEQIRERQREHNQQSVFDFEKMLHQLDFSKQSKSFPQELYAALCNQGWRHQDQSFTCSWRAAGGLVAEVDGCSDTDNYLDYYCSGNEGTVSEEVKEALAEFGWKPCSYQMAAALQEPTRVAYHLGEEQLLDWLKAEHPGEIVSISYKDGSAEARVGGQDIRYLLAEDGSAYKIINDEVEKEPFLDPPDTSALYETAPIDA